MECLRCGFCCTVVTCHIGLSHGAEQTNCKFLIGDKPGEYSCWLAKNKVYPTIRTDLAIGKGCCMPLASRGIMKKFREEGVMPDYDGIENEQKIVDNRNSFPVSIRWFEWG